MDYFKMLFGTDMRELEIYVKTHDINEEINNQTLLYWAAYDNNLSFVDYLLKQGVDVNKKDQHNRTPLMVACYYGFYDIARLLLSHKAHTEGCMEWATNGWDGNIQTKIIELLSSATQNR